MYISTTYLFIELIIRNHDMKLFKNLKVFLKNIITKETI